MVGGVDHQRVTFEIIGRQRVENLADHAIHALDQAPVGSAGAPRFVGVRVCQAGGRSPALQEGVCLLLIFARLARRRQAVGVTFIVGAARHVGRMRQHEANAERKGRVVHAGAALHAEAIKPVHGGRGDGLVMYLVAGLPGPGQAQTGAFWPGRAVQLAQDGTDIREGGEVGRMVADQALAVAVQLVRADRVHAPDQRGPVTGGAHAVRQRGYAGIEHVTVGPDFILPGVTTGEHGHARGHADRRATIVAGEERASACQAIQMRRMHVLVAVAACNRRVMLVRMDVEQIGPRAFRHAFHRSVPFRFVPQSFVGREAGSRPTKEFSRLLLLQGLPSSLRRLLRA